MTKLRIGVIFGGRSGEHAVSLMSARFVLSVLDPVKYDVTEIGINRQGRWLHGKNTLNALLEENEKGLMPVSILPDPTRSGLVQLESQGDGKYPGHVTELDVLFPVLHGTFGEDGTLQGLFDMAGLAYVGAGVLGSSVAMDKALFFDLMRANEIPVVDTVLIISTDIKNNLDLTLEKVENVGEYPLFVKPANLGSSVGISKVNNRSDLIEGLMEAAQYDRRIIVQRGLNVREIEVSVLGNNDPQASICGEIAPAAEFYSYEAKYHDDRSQAIIPADIPKDISDRIRELAINAFKLADLAGMARVDFFYENESGDVYINEINTIPGFTEISMFPLLWEASGVSNGELLDRLIELALERHAEKNAIRHDFQRMGS